MGDGAVRAGGPVRTRFAPSPTGEVHIGNVVAVLISASIARKHGGQFFIRLEDTDRSRYQEGAEGLIYNALSWLGIEWDEGPDKGGPYGPYRQSERLDRYRAYTEQLLASGAAYRCWCTPERLDQMRKEQQARKVPPRYDRLCLGKSEAERRALPGFTDRYTVRVLMPTEGQFTFTDAIRGDITFDYATQQDHILVRSDGFPVYHLAAMVDDHDMRTTHIVRGEEWISTTPVHYQVFKAFGWDVPAIAHSPLLLNTDRTKISKRKHPWAKVEWFMEQGFLPEAVVNYLGNLVAFVPDPENPDPSIARELFGLEEIAKHIDLANIGPSGKIIDIPRLEWLNGQYIRRLSLREFSRRVAPFMRDVAGLDQGILSKALPLEQERLKRLSEAPEVLGFFFRDEQYDPKILIPKGLDGQKALEILQASRDAIEDLATEGPSWTAEAIKDALWPLAEALGVKTGQLFGAGTVRAAVTCRLVGPPLFETMEALGVDTVRRRLDAAIERLSLVESAR
ncbi:MAG TPA: glutamate--tRNA ligase [Chloroflexota bacterium]|nr:glutamate--tRNA ligase [Chloroflexota bacterium]